MNTTRSLTASAEVFDKIGETFSADTCRQMIRDCASMDETFGEGAGDALHRHFASQLAIRAAEKLEAHNRKDAA